MTKKALRFLPPTVKGRVIGIGNHITTTGHEAEAEEGQLDC